MSTPTVILSPETLPGSTACVVVNGPLGKLYVQALDAYGFQRELSVVEIPEGFRVSVYMHPGRRSGAVLSKRLGERFLARFVEQVQAHPGLLFNTPGADFPRCHGFVHLCEAIHGGEPVSAKLL